MSDVNVTQGMQELLSRLPKTDTHEFTSILNPAYRREDIAFSLTPDNYFWHSIERVKRMNLQSHIVALRSVPQ